MVELYARVRRAVQVEQMSEREAARTFGLSRETVRKMLKFSLPPGYRRQAPIRRPKLDAYAAVIDQILVSDQQAPRKQRHSAKRIFERLRDEHGYGGGYTVVKDYVREHKQRRREMFVPLHHAPGHAQVDFGEADIYVQGVLERAHFFVMDLPHSDDAFVMAFPAETTEAFCEGHKQAFAYFGGVPLSILYDNTKLAVAHIQDDGTRQTTRAFRELQSHYLFAERFGRPGKGNDKGKVEGLVGYARRNFLVPLPRVSSYDELNQQLLRACQQRRAKVLRGHQDPIGQRFEWDRQALLPLPVAPYEACEKQVTRVSSLSLVRYRGNDYSVPVEFGHREVIVKGSVHEVIICCGAQEIARHPRSYEKHQAIYEPRHYLPLLEQKTNALDQAAPLAGWELPEEFAHMRRLLEARQAKQGKREYVQILRLLEHFSLTDVQAALQQALQLQALSFAAVRHLLLCRIERKPPRLDLENYPHWPAPCVAQTAASDYLPLLAEGARR
jgi:transposase